jgi:hypothetical protein
MATSVLNRFQGLGVFGDEVYTSTDLNRRAGEVLTQARSRPVTISRNNEQFALLRRDDAASLIRTVNGIAGIIGILVETKSAIRGEEPSPRFSWLKVFDKDDLEKLCSEVLGATNHALNTQTDFESVTSLIHEWRESALVAQSGVIDAALFTEDGEETPLSHPSTAVDKTISSLPICQES